MVDVDAPRKLRGGKRRRYDVDGNDEEYFGRIEKDKMGNERKTMVDVSELRKQHRM